LNDAGFIIVKLQEGHHENFLRCRLIVKIASLKTRLSQGELTKRKSLTAR
jgi:hypothetical protein